MIEKNTRVTSLDLDLNDSREKSLTSWEETIAQDEQSVGVWSMEQRATLDAQTLMSLFYSEDWVYITVDLLSSEFAQPYPRVMQKSYVDGQLVLKPAEQHPLQNLLEDPNEYSDASAFFYRCAVMYNLMGNVFIWYMRANNQLVILPSHEVQIEFDDRTLIPKNYLWQSRDGQRVLFKKEDILHIQRPNPASAYWGLSPFLAGRRSILFNRYSEEFLNTYFERGATPQIILASDSIINKDTLALLQKSFELAQGGRKNQRKPLVLPKGVTATSVALSIADANLIELINTNRENILNLLRIPKHAVGLQTSGSLGSEEYKTALKFMWKSTVNPQLKRFSTALTKFFRRQLGEGFLIDFDVSEIESMSQDMINKTTIATNMLKTHTLNEVRRQIWEAAPLDGGDVTPVTATPQPAWGSPTSSVSTISQALDMPITPVNKFNDGNNLMQHEDYISHQKSIDEELSNDTAKKMYNLSVDTMIKQYKTCLEIAKETMGQKSKANNNDDVKDEMISEMAKDRNEWANKYQEILNPTVNFGYLNQLKLVFNPANREAVGALAQETSRGRKAILAKRALDSFAWISETTSDKIISSIEAGTKEGLSIAQIANKLIDGFAELTHSRATTITRTESLTAVSIGQKDAIKNAAKVMPDAKKVWLTAGDDRVRDSHADMHMVEVAINDDFEVGNSNVKMSVPRDPRAKGYPEEVINCRCTTAIYNKGDL